jgi:hypothetical protein
MGSSAYAADWLNFRAQVGTGLMSITFNSPQLKFYGSSGTLLGTCPVSGNVTSVSGILSFSCPASGQFTNWTTVTLTSTNRAPQSFTTSVVGLYSVGATSTNSPRLALISLDGLLVDVTSDEPTMLDVSGDEPTMIDITSDEPTMLELGGTSAWLNIGGLRPNWSAWGGTSVEPIINR